jgi:hypothetical protein
VVDQSTRGSPSGGHGYDGPVAASGTGRVQRIALVGMGRSGTSFLARFLAASGVFFDQNGKGKKLEHPEAREINDAICAERFGAHEGLPYGRLPDGDIEVGEPWTAKVAAFVAQMDGRAEAAGARYWAVKDPRLTILHRLWLPEIDIAVGIFRDPFQVVASYLKQDWVHGLRKRGTTLRYWTRFNSSLLKIAGEANSDRPVYVLDFNADMPAQLEHLCSRLGIPRNEKAFALYRATEDHEAGFASPASLEAKKLHSQLITVRNLL